MVAGAVAHKEKMRVDTNSLPGALQAALPTVLGLIYGDDGLHMCLHSLPDCGCQILIVHFHSVSIAEAFFLRGIHVPERVFHSFCAGFGVGAFMDVQGKGGGLNNRLC